jgi:hypothetical protein
MLLHLVFAAIAAAQTGGRAPLTPEQLAAQQAQQKATQEDRQKMLDLLGIKELRPGRNGSNPRVANFANYDESKANPYPKLPEPLVFNNGKPVKSAKEWWSKRRPEIVELVDREIYGRVPKVTPRVKWEVSSTANETTGDVPVLVKRLVGHGQLGVPGDRGGYAVNADDPGERQGACAGDHGIRVCLPGRTWSCGRTRSDGADVAAAGARERAGLRDPRA